MTNEKLYEVLGDINEKHINEARAYHKAKKPGWVKWGAMAACLCLMICAVAIPNLINNTDIPEQGAGNFTSMLFVNNTLYQRVDHKDNLADKESEFVYLGEIETKVDVSQTPTENFQTNDDIIGGKVYQYGEDIVVLVDGDYLLYSVDDAPVRGGSTPEATQSDNDTNNNESSEPAQYNYSD